MPGLVAAFLATGLGGHMPGLNAHIGLPHAWIWSPGWPHAWIGLPHAWGGKSLDNIKMCYLDRVATCLPGLGGHMLGLGGRVLGLVWAGTGVD